MSIYATLWALQFPRFGEFHIGCEWVTVIAQGVPAHVGAEAPDPYASLSTLRNWEQGRREPTGPAKALIRAITNDPKHVLKALEVGQSMRKAG
jgi:putative transcriptional regulator